MENFGSNALAFIALASPWCRPPLWQTSPRLNFITAGQALLFTSPTAAFTKANRDYPAILEGRPNNSGEYP
ncbi:MAG: hypothetical protein WD397_04170 [Wenzhouxiangellaceae bacterium]